MSLCQWHKLIFILWPYGAICQREVQKKNFVFKKSMNNYEIIYWLTVIINLKKGNLGNFFFFFYF